ncbi:nucleoside 2-deoxyribosyltransferase [Gluconacetobacter johannae DSM 13595]|uniref:Nucleoside 2-deoxyribosyltransferase n=1 Tax=Gluconacetobacter johannae TaxID=112140 RepID=A0A7W4J6S4_9PROT|nr:nucleoside 2-deoxyribosyltransferase [Gluconacetobacter johannae]MBB2175717.1 nucleoside 2-deoxyribosyltransferase [Gluconacetobacter johannae]GBQ83112.1 nucleoside 2-deoxyribosyltransferase [Gluconacetobacter johannae DSM 13595]
MTTRGTVYLAGDLVFRPGAIAIFDHLRALCDAAGVTGLAPFDGQAGIEALPQGLETTLKIVRADRDLMDRCDGGIFCIDPFRRSADMDPGTAVEIGYMMAQGKPLAGYTTDGRLYPEKVRAYCRAAWGDDLRPRTTHDAPVGSGAVEDCDGILAHSDGMLQNGMVEGFIRLSGGGIAVHDDFYEAFRLAITDLASRLRVRA